MMRKLKVWFVENRRLPSLIGVLSHLLVAWLFYAAFGMFLALFMLGLDWTKQEAVTELPLFIGKLIPYTFYVAPENLSAWMLVLVFLTSCLTWLFSTRVQMFNKNVSRRAFSFLLSWGTIALWLNTYFSTWIYRYGYVDILNIHDGADAQYQEMFHRGSLELLAFALMIIPEVLTISLFIYLLGKYRDEDIIQEWFRTFKFQNGTLGRFGDETVNKLPDIQLARDEETNAPFVLGGDSRQLGVMLIGPPGSGKTSMKIKIAFRQDLGHLQRTINQFPKLVEKHEDVNSLDFKMDYAQHLIGSIIIEPAKDLCDSAYKLSLEHGIPEDMVFYINPRDPNSPGFNPMVGPVDKVSEMIADVLDAIAVSSEEFFRQAAKTVVKNYVSLLKFAKGDNCTLLELNRMYQDPRFVMDLVEEVEKTLPSDEAMSTMAKTEYVHWLLVKEKIRWFRNEGVAEDRGKDGMVETYPKGHEHENKVKVSDMQFEFTRMTRNLLGYLVGNEHLARIFMEERGVDLDQLMKKGGIFLCNTDLGLLGKTSSAAFGKLVLLCVQNAVFRREGGELDNPEDVRPLVSMYCDEFYNYMNEDFLDLTSQGRKYKFAPFVACQTLSQFGVKFGGEMFTKSMMGTIRNFIVYGGVGRYDAQLLSEEFGMHEVEELQTRESVTPSNMSAPNLTYMEGTTKKEEEVAKADDIMFQEFRYSYIKMVDQKSTQRGKRAVGDFVDSSEIDQWKKALNPEAMNIYMEYWKSDHEINPYSDEIGDGEEVVESKEVVSTQEDPDSASDISVEEHEDKVKNRFRQIYYNRLQQEQEDGQHESNVEAAAAIEDLEVSDESNATLQAKNEHATAKNEPLKEEKEQEETKESSKPIKSFSGVFGQQGVVSESKPNSDEKIAEATGHTQSKKPKGNSFSGAFAEKTQDSKESVNSTNNQESDVLPPEYDDNKDPKVISEAVKNKRFNELEDVEFNDDTRSILERIKGKK